MSKKRKRFLAVFLLLAFVLCCIPIKLAYKDGGTVKYQAVLWSYTQYHRLLADGGVYEGTAFRLFPFNFAD